MSSTLSVPQWFGAGELSRAASEFGFTFVGDDDDVVKQEYHPALPPIPPLIPLGEAGRMLTKQQLQVSENNNNNLNLDSDDSAGGRFGADEPSNGEGASYGGVIMVNSGEQDEDEEKLLRLFGGGDVSDASLCSSAATTELACADSGGDCSVVLDTLPTDLLRSLSTEGRISVDRLSRTVGPCQNGAQASDNSGGARDVTCLLTELVSEVQRGADEEGVGDAASAHQRQEPQLPHQTNSSGGIDDCDEDDVSRDSCRGGGGGGGVAATTVAPPAADTDTTQFYTETANRKSRHRKQSDSSPRKAVRRRRERRSSSSSGKKRRKRSTSCSTTSSTCSNASSLRHHHRHHRKHRHRRRSPELSVEEPPPTPRVNPIFVWIKQDDTRIVEVLCEDYDKRNRIRLTKTAHGWRAIPRTERLASATSATVVNDDNQQQSAAPAATVSTVSPSAEKQQEPGSEPVPPVAASPSHVHSEAPLVSEEQQVDGLLTDGEAVAQNSDEYSHLQGTENDLSTVIEEEEQGEGEMAKEEEEDDELCEEEESELRDTNDEQIEIPEEEQNFHEEMMIEDHCDMENVNNSDYGTGEGEIFDDEFLAEEEDCMEEEDLTPTDLSIPKPCDENQSTTVLPKIIPRCMSTVIPPVVQSPQPRQSPAQSIAPAPAHQPKTQHKSMFLESLLSSPRKCHEPTRRLSLDVDKGLEPLNLGVTCARGAGSPTVSCSDESRKTARPMKDPAKGEPKPKCLKVEDITLKNLLSRQPHTTVISPEIELTLTSKKEEMTESGRKSRLLELLTSEPAPASISPSPTLDPLTQLKKVLSDPDITVPDPLLVPRSRLQELVANPAKEIPRLLALRPELRLPEALAYPTLLRDPDLLVVSLSHLQHLLQKPDKIGKDEDTSTYSTLGTFLEWQRYQNQQQAAAVAKEILDSQLKQQQQQQQKQQQQQQQELDAAAAAALNQMLWMPYLTQLEAAAVQCGNNQDFLAALNHVFNSYPTNAPQYPYGPGVNPAAFNATSNDYKNQMELQHTLALWHEAMIQASAVAANNNNNNNNRPSKNPPVLNNMSKPFNSNGRYPHAARKYNSSSARTSPVVHNNFHSQSAVPHPQRNSAGNQHYIPPNGYGTTVQLHQQYNLQRCRSSGGSTNNVTAASKLLKQEDSKSGNVRQAVNSSPALNILNVPRRQDILSSQSSKQQSQQHSHLLAALGKPTSTTPPGQQQNGDSIPQLVSLSQPLDLSGPPTATSVAPRGKPAPKLKVKQHLVDPSFTPKLLLKDDPPPEVGSTTNHPHLWHPLFGSQKTSLSSPWRWTTVTVNGE